MTPHAAHAGYRAEIDGLRAVAVTGVVLFHAHVLGLPGGFTGVDVFFVISGYLITRILLDEHARTGRISIPAFYERRVRRILPAFYAMLAVSTGAAAVLFSPGDFVGFAGSGLAALFFTSNIHFWLAAGYFSAKVQTAPLLHTWSLSVEEQFYLLWPLALILLLGSRQARGWLVPAASAAALLSLASAEWGARNMPEAAFYLMPTRAFQLLIGALLAMPGAIPTVRDRQVAELLAVLGLAAILAAYVGVGRHTPFPGVWALLPTLGAAAVIHVGRDSRTVAAFLSSRPVVFVGLVSYSWYLWHWPAFAFWRYATFRDPTPVEAIAIVMLSFGAAVLSWRFVERPFRQRPSDAAGASTQAGHGGWRGIALLGIVPAILAAGVFGTIRVSDGFPGRVAPSVATLSSQVHAVSPWRDACLLLPLQGSAPPPAASCVGGAEGRPPSALLWGDSHATHYAPTLDALGRQQGFAFRLASRAACPPLLDARHVRERPIYSGDCQAFNEAIFSLLDAHPEITEVWLAGYWPLHARSMDNRNDELAGALAETVHRLQASGRDVHVFGVIPVFPFDAGGCVVRQARFPFSAIDCTLEPERLAVTQGLDEALSDAVGEAYLPVLSEICPIPEACSPIVDSSAAYSDANHLTVDFATKLADRLIDIVD